MDQQNVVGPGKLALLGSAAGLLGGFFGVGGGIILVPLLVWVGFGRHRAHATSLASFIIIATAGAVSYGIAGDISVRFGIAIGLGGVVGSIIGASLMNRMSSRNLGIVFSVVLLVAGMRMVLGGDPITSTSNVDIDLLTLFAFGIGLVSGLFAGLVGIGGGAVIVPAGVLLLGLEQHVAQGTSLVAIILTAIAGSVVNVRNRRVRLQDAAFIGVGGIIGSVIGTQLALGIEGRTLSVAFGLLVLFIAGRSLFQALREPATA